MTNFKKNHYVPEWYQRQFFLPDMSEQKIWYLDLNPKPIRHYKGKPIFPTKIPYKGPKSCFAEDDLYTRFFEGTEDREIEKQFFGDIDDKGKHAIEHYRNFDHDIWDNEKFNDLLQYMSSQKLRTPRGLKELSQLTGSYSQNSVLDLLVHLNQINCAAWTECIWSIVKCEQNGTGFLISDNPITLYNMAIPPDETMRPDRWQNGTQTIFPLSAYTAMVFTNTAWARNPYANPLESHPFPQSFRTAIFDHRSIQIGRVLSEKEVIAVNHIIKKSADRYIAAPVKEWLFPEKKVQHKDWNHAGLEYLVMPDPRSMSFSCDMIIGHNDGSQYRQDEYGRPFFHPLYNDEKRRKHEWQTFLLFQAEYAIKFGRTRKGRSMAMSKMDPKVDTQECQDSHVEYFKKHRKHISRRQYRRPKTIRIRK